MNDQVLVQSHGGILRWTGVTSGTARISLILNRCCRGDCAIMIRSTAFQGTLYGDSGCCGRCRNDCCGPCDRSGSCQPPTHAMRITWGCQRRHHRARRWYMDGMMYILGILDNGDNVNLYLFCVDGRWLSVYQNIQIVSFMYRWDKHGIDDKAKKPQKTPTPIPGTDDTVTSR